MSYAGLITSANCEASFTSDNFEFKLRKEKVLRKNDRLMKQFSEMIDQELLSDFYGKTMITRAEFFETIAPKYDSMAGNYT